MENTSLNYLSQQISNQFSCHNLKASKVLKEIAVKPRQLALLFPT